MRYTITDNEGLTLIEASVDTKTYDDEHVIKVKADSEQWITPEQAEDLAAAFARLAKEARVGFQNEAYKASIKQFEKLSELVGKKDKTPSGLGGLQ